ncbi:MAG: RusA family crossover junction endodeoxyribonuclease [Dokdonella sp.]
MIALVLPWPPSGNRYYRNVAGRTLIGREGREYRQAVVRIIRSCAVGSAALPFRGRLRVTLLAAPPDRRRRDLDNLQKALLDACTHGGLWEDDSQIDDLRIVRGPIDRNNGAIAIQTEEILEAIAA